MPQWYGKEPASVKVKEKLCPVPRVVLENFPDTSLTTVCGAESRFVQVTVVPLGIVTDAGLNRKLWMVTATGAGGDVVVVTGGVVMAVVGGVVTVVVGGMVVVGTAVVAAGVVGGAVVAGVAWVVVGAGPGGASAQPAARTARRTTAPMAAYHFREIQVLMEVPHGMSPFPEYIPDPSRTFDKRSLHERIPGPMIRGFHRICEGDGEKRFYPHFFCCIAWTSASRVAFRRSTASSRLFVMVMVKELSVFGST